MPTQLVEHGFNRLLRVEPLGLHRNGLRFGAFEEFWDGVFLDLVVSKNKTKGDEKPQNEERIGEFFHFF